MLLFDYKYHADLTDVLNSSTLGFFHCYFFRIEHLLFNLSIHLLIGFPLEIIHGSRRIGGMYVAAVTLGKLYCRSHGFNYMTWIVRRQGIAIILENRYICIVKIPVSIRLWKLHSKADRWVWHFVIGSGKKYRRHSWCPYVTLGKITKAIWHFASSCVTYVQYAAGKMRFGFFIPYMWTSSSPRNMST